ncbi:cytoplasmic dynein 2 light intermediate chain 1-like [Lineus longissimus]|uniref:cytoplasmic dynein 2 light intermediate chain 1-like n=1 Tax=Lineus longissimus TaxID=88925 RepID=UPI002B4C3848
MSRGESVWDLASNQAKAAEVEEGKAGEESSVLFVGSKNSGKTSIILRFLDRDEAPKPTTALEYTFGRRAKGHNIAKDVGHIWELGGGTWLSKLIDIPINEDSILHTSLILVLDLSLPNELWVTLETMLHTAKSRLNEVIGRNSKLRDTLKQRAIERVGQDHQDKDMIDPFPIPLVMIGGKYDIFQDFDPEKRKVVCKTLRFVAHTYGATLQFFSTKQENLMNKSRVIISNLVFGTAPSKTLQTEHNKPISVVAGADCLSQIGSPPIAEGDLGRLNARTPLDLWKHAFITFFPQENLNDQSVVDDPAKDPQYTEAVIDNLRSQKDEELERYRRLCERRAKETAAMSADGY